MCRAAASSIESVRATHELTSCRWYCLRCWGHPAMLTLLCSFWGRIPWDPGVKMTPGSGLQFPDWLLVGWLALLACDTNPGSLPCQSPLTASPSVSSTTMTSFISFKVILLCNFLFGHFLLLLFLFIILICHCCTACSMPDVVECMQDVTRSSRGMISSRERLLTTNFSRTKTAAH